MAKVFDLSRVSDHRLIAGTGWHLFSDLVVYGQLSDYLAWEVNRSPSLIVVSGAQQGWDSALTKACREIGIPYVLCVPSRNFGSYYWRDRKSDYEAMVKAAVSVEYTTDWLSSVGASSAGFMRYAYAGEAMHVNMWRNRRMIQLCLSAASSLFVAYWSGEQRGGTTSCLWDLSRTDIGVVHFGERFSPSRDIARLWEAGRWRSVVD